MYIAHKSIDKQRQQSVLEHLEGTAKYAQDFATVFGCGDYGRCLGMLHDIGKYSAGFQKRIQDGGCKVDHSTAGAQLVRQLSRSPSTLAASYCIAGHHRGLLDGGSSADDPAESTLSARLKLTPEDYQAFRTEIDPTGLFPNVRPPLHMLGTSGFTIAFWIRMLYSCLVDADFLDTEAFMSNGSVVREPGEGIPALYEKLEEKLKEFKHPTNELNRMRCKILDRCLQMAEAERGLFTLTVPTGGGKTLSSLAFALKHAVRHKMRRVIYVIPYTSIIEQTAATFRDIVGDGNLLEHHHNFQYDFKNDEMDPRRLAAENWDKPLIVTTNVQFFESFFANKSSRCRKLHNVANSILIFDEAQMLPREYLLPCIRVISELVHNYGCSAVLCTATQPALQDLFPPEIRATEIMEDVPSLYAFFKRTEIRTIGPLSNEALVERLDAHQQVLCIVNTREHARVLYDRIKDENTFHLTTLMTPVHRTRTLEEIRQRLKEGLPCRVISTSLVEAGVDFDFPTVYRAEAGLDSEIQAAGRCNREGKRPAEDSIVYIFQPEEPYRNTQTSFLKPISVARDLAHYYPDIASPESIHTYFQELYKISGNELDSKEIVRRLEEGAGNALFPFETVAKEFHLIDERTKTILIPAEEKAKDFAKQLRRGERNQKLLRAIGPYCVSIYENHYQALIQTSALEVLDDEIAILADLSLYNEKTGLSLQIGKGGIGFFS